MTDAVAIQWFTFATVVGTAACQMLLQLYREWRNHKWETDERERVASQLAAKVKADHQVLADTLEIERITQQEFREKTATALQGVHDAATGAFTEANHANVKISNINERILAQQQQQSADREITLQEIRQTVGETRDIVGGIEKKMP